MSAAVVARGIPPKKESLYMAYMPNTSTQLAVTGATSFLGLALTQWVIIAAAIIVIGGIVIAMSKLAGPRIALEPVYDEAKGKRRMRITRNGTPIKWSRRKR